MRHPRSTSHPARVKVLAGLALLVAITFGASGRFTGPSATPPPSSPTRSSVAAASPTPPVPARSSSLAPAALPSPESAQSSVAPSATPPLTMAKSTPVRMTIPAIGVDSELMDLGLQDDGTIEVPPEGFPAGWYTGAPTPGELGPAIVAGHIDWGGQPGVFVGLRDLQPDDEVTVAREDGSTAMFRVTRVERFPKAGFPTAVVYGDIDHAGLRLITCGGSFNRQAHSYDDNIVVFAELVGARST